jgi:UDP-glucose 4-epimerase
MCLSYNLGCGGDGYSVRQVIDAAAAVTGRNIEVIVAGRQEGDPAVLVASSERICRDLRWTPRYTQLDRIVQSAWHWLVRRGLVGSNDAKSNGATA